MQKQFKSLHLLRKFTAVAMSAPVTTVAPFPLVLQYNAKECCQCLVTTAHFFKYIDTGSALLIKKYRCYTSAKYIHWKWSYAYKALLSSKIVPQLTDTYKWQAVLVKVEISAHTYAVLSAFLRDHMPCCHGRARRNLC